MNLLAIDSVGISTQKFIVRIQAFDDISFTITVKGEEAAALEKAVLAAVSERIRALVEIGGLG